MVSISAMLQTNERSTCYKNNSLFQTLTEWENFGVAIKHTAIKLHQNIDILSHPSPMTVTPFTSVIITQPQV